MLRAFVVSALALLTASFGSRANPLMNGADPHVIELGGEFWMFPTESGARRPIFAAYHSTDLRQWRRVGPILELDRIPWVPEDGAPRHHAWAPAMAEKGGKFYFYYSVGPQNPTPSRIGVAVGDSPSGPFRDIGKPLLTGGNGFEAIDPMVYVDRKSGRAWFYAGGSAGSKLRVFELNDDMISFKREVPVAQPPHFTEAPFVHERNGTYYLSYSHGRWNDDSYSVHYATSKAPEGPWEYRGRILSSDDRRKGPGHHSFVKHPKTQQWYIVYHRWENPGKQTPYRGARKIAVEKISYDLAGRIRPIRMTGGDR